MTHETQSDWEATTSNYIAKDQKKVITSCVVEAKVRNNLAWYTTCMQLQSLPASHAGRLWKQRDAINQLARLCQRLHTFPYFFTSSFLIFYFCFLRQPLAQALLWPTVSCIWHSYQSLSQPHQLQKEVNQIWFKPNWYWKVNTSVCGSLVWGSKVRWVK